MNLGEDARLVRVAVIDQNGRRVVDRWLWAGDEHVVDHALWLAPGTYRVVLETPEGREGEGILEVPANPTEAPALELVL